MLHHLITAAAASVALMACAVNGQVQSKGSVIYSPACGLEDRNGTWEVDWRLALHQDNNAAFARQVTVHIAGIGEVCQIDLDTCGQLPAEDLVDACYCKKNAGLNYELVTKRLARVEESELPIVTSLPFAGECHPQDLSKDQGFVPPVYGDKKDVAATFRLDAGITMDLAPSQTIAVCNGHYAALNICIMNLNPNFHIDVACDLQGWSTSMATTCIDIDLKFDFRNHSSYDVVVTYGENTWCPRSGEYVITFVETDIECPPLLCEEPERTSCEAGDGILKYHTAALPNLEDKVVLCDSQTDGGNWTVIQRRENGITDFYREFYDYRNGFGLNFTNFWIGLEHIHQLCYDPPCELRIDLTYNEEKKYAKYSSFSVDGQANAYKLTVSGYSGDAGDGLSDGNGKKFSTSDRDHDDNGGNCAVKSHGAWWYRNCHYGNLNGKYDSTDILQGMNWADLTGYTNSVSFSEMKVRQPLAAPISGTV